MSDNIFDRLAEMLSSSESVNWELAAELGTSIAGDEGALSPGSDAHWNEYVETARHFLADVPGIRPQTDFEVHVVDRRQWTSAQVRGFEYLATPLAEKLREDPSNPMGALFSILVGLKVGSMAGSLSHRVMGNFEAALPPLSSSGLWLVAPNIEEFSTDHGLDSKQVDLWVALNELIHASMFAMPGAPQRLRNLVSTYIEGLEFNPQALPMDPMAQGVDPEELAVARGRLRARVRDQSPARARLRLHRALRESASCSTPRAGGSPRRAPSRRRRILCRNRAEMGPRLGSENVGFNREFPPLPRARGSGCLGGTRAVAVTLNHKPPAADMSMTRHTGLA